MLDRWLEVAKDPTLLPLFHTHTLFQGIFPLKFRRRCLHIVPLEPELSMSIEISKDTDSSGSKGTIYAVKCLHGTRVCKFAWEQRRKIKCAEVYHHAPPPSSSLGSNVCIVAEFANLEDTVC